MRIVIVGGCGHVGLPLAVSLADCGAQVTAFDINKTAVDLVNSEVPPFYEESLEAMLSKNLGNGFIATTDPKVISDADVVIMIVGTPLTGHRNPDPNVVIHAVKELGNFLRDDQLLILRSTVFPGVTNRIEFELKKLGLNLHVAFAPERIVEGAAMKELRELPQIIGARDEVVFEKAKVVFDLLKISSIRTTPEEAELAKLFTNTWRYIKFAAANQFWMMANDAGVEYEKVRAAIRFEYPRAADLPGAGFAAGPCLFKDTMQLAAFRGNNFPLGNAAMQVNEGQPDYIVEKIKKNYNLSQMKVGILGMAFKGESDDTRSSLAYKLKRILKFNSLEVLTTDPFVMTDESLLPLNKVLEESDLLIIAAPHKEYRLLQIEKPIIDIWNLRETGTLI
jgi:UDP-N-acetyl-D-mannosaminuronic acid dehydrogenase